MMRLFASLAFCLILILMVGGAELFTGNNLPARQEIVVEG
jgi:hypothetical protein